MATKLAIMPIAAVLVLLLFAGVAQATTCAAGYKDCDKNYYKNGCEVNIHTDVNNCGDCGCKCGALCGPNTIPVCKAAKCKFSCKAPFQNCDSDWKNGCEVDISKDVNNCGACKAKCIAPAYAIASCENHKCQYSCKPGWKNCDGKWENGCETDVGKDVNNCGACKAKCIAPAYAIASCENHKCKYSCMPGWKNCDGKWENGCETDVGKDVSNCNGCGCKCPVAPNSTPKCANYKCESTCKPGYSNCDGDWSNGCESCIATDPNNCGACKAKCIAPVNATAKCTDHKCEYSCKPGYTNCDGDWSNGCEATCGSDVSNCGACGHKCEDVANAVTKCDGGKCEYTCKKGYFNCDGDWKNGCEGMCGSDVNNCGKCGKKCEDVANAETKCDGGKCEYTCEAGYDNCDGDWSNGCECLLDTDVDNCGECGHQCSSPKYFGGEAKCTDGECETQYCKSGWKWDNEKSCCVDVAEKTCIFSLCF